MRLGLAMEVARGNVAYAMVAQNVSGFLSRRGLRIKLNMRDRK